MSAQARQDRPQRVSVGKACRRHTLSERDMHPLTAKNLVHLPNSTIRHLFWT
jgi:hypothetical protein